MVPFPNSIVPREQQLLVKTLVKAYVYMDTQVFMELRSFDKKMPKVSKLKFT